MVAVYDWVGSLSLFAENFTLHIQYCAKVMQAKSTNFVLCSPDVSSKVRAKIQVQIRGA